MPIKGFDSITTVEEAEGNPWSLNGYVRFQLDGPSLIPLSSDPDATLKSVAKLPRLEQIPGAVCQNKNLDWL